MTAVSSRRFEMKPSAKEVKKRKMSSALSSITHFMEQKIDSSMSETLHILLLQAIICGNLSWNFLNNPYFKRFLVLLRPSYKFPSGDIFKKNMMESRNRRLFNGK